MGASSFTPNYHLPQFAGDDKPSWLGDINTAFSDIDLGIEEANVTANNGLSTAQEAFNKINDTLSLLEEQIDKINSLAGEMENFNGFLMPVPEWNISFVEGNNTVITGVNAIRLHGSQKIPMLTGTIVIPESPASIITGSPASPYGVYWPIFNINYNLFNLQPGDYATSKNVIYIANLSATRGTTNTQIGLVAIWNGGYTRFATNGIGNPGNNTTFTMENLILPVTGKQFIYNPENTQPEEDN